MKYIKKMNLLDEMFTEKEIKKIKKNYDTSYKDYTITKEKNQK